MSALFSLHTDQTPTEPDPAASSTRTQTNTLHTCHVSPATANTPYSNAHTPSHHTSYHHQHGCTHIVMYNKNAHTHEFRSAKQRHRLDQQQPRTLNHHHHHQSEKPTNTQPSRHSVVVLSFLVIRSRAPVRCGSHNTTHTYTTPAQFIHIQKVLVIKLSEHKRMI